MKAHGLTASDLLSTVSVAYRLRLRTRGHRSCKVMSCTEKLCFYLMRWAGSLGPRTEAHGAHSCFISFLGLCVAVASGKVGGSCLRLRYGTGAGSLGGLRSSECCRWWMVGSTGLSNAAGSLCSTC